MTARLATARDLPMLELICNDPSIRLWSAFDGAPPSKPSGYLRGGSFIVICEQDGNVVGCFPSKRMEPGVFSVHACLLPNGRANSELHARDAMSLAFGGMMADRLTAGIPTSCPHAAMIARRIGFGRLFRIEGLWPSGGRMHDIDIFAIDRETWEGVTTNPTQEYSHA